MDGPGEYLPDVSEGITRVEDLPKAKVAQRSRNYRRRPCPECGHSAYRDRVVTRTLHDLGDLKNDRPVDVKRTLKRITRGLPHLRRLRDIMDEVYRLFDRRCRTDTALEKLAKLRSRARRFKHVGRTLNKLFSPNLDKALTFLDDSPLPSTSNAVEGGFRRHRKMQKTVYRVRTRAQMSRRIAADMQRDAQAQGRTQTAQSLHKERNRDP